MLCKSRPVCRVGGVWCVSCCRQRGAGAEREVRVQLILFIQRVQAMRGKHALGRRVPYVFTSNHRPWWVYYVRVGADTFG